MNCGARSPDSLPRPEQEASMQTRKILGLAEADSSGQCELGRRKSPRIYKSSLENKKAVVNRGGLATFNVFPSKLKLKPPEYSSMFVVPTYESKMNFPNSRTLCSLRSTLALFKIRKFN